MRRLFVLAAALAMMWAVKSLRMDGALAGADPLTLAAVGFVVLAAFTVGELGGALKLPKITGYIVSGVLLGPQVWDVLSKQVVVEMQTFNTLALGLIATTAGLELDLGAIRKVFRTLVVTVASKVPLLLFFVGGAFYGFEATFGVLNLPGNNEILALGLIFAVLGIGTSPAIALAIVNETGAKGRLSDLVLAIAVVKDLVVVVCLALAIAVARVLLVPDSPLGADVLLPVAEELGASIAVGSAVGFVLIAYMRFVKAEMLLAVLAAIVATAELSHTLHLELLLVFIAAGFVVRNFSKYEHELLHSLERIALPVFVVFFTTAGANVDLKGTLTLLPLAIVIGAARAGAFYLAARLGSAAGKEAAPVANNAWYAYLPQAGVTLGLVFLAAEKLPEISEAVEKTGLAMVALHLILGPILLGIALKRAGEIPSADAKLKAEDPNHEPEPEPEHAKHVAPRVEPFEAPDGPTALPATAEQIRTQLVHSELVEPVETVRAALEQACLQFVANVARPRVEDARAYAEGIFDDPEEDESTVMAIHRRLPKQRPDLGVGWASAVLNFEQSLRAKVHRLPMTVSVPMSVSLLAPSCEDSFVVGLKKRVRALAGSVGIRRGKVRDVPLCLLGRLAGEARLAEAAIQLASAWPRAYSAMLDRARAVATEGLVPAQGDNQVDKIAADFIAYVEAVLRSASADILQQLCADACKAGSPELPLSQLRFSKVEPVARAARGRVKKEGPAWRRVCDAAFDTVAAHTAVVAFAETLSGVLAKRVHAPLETTKEQLVPVVEQVRQRLGAALEQLQAPDLTPAQLERAVGLAKGAYPKADRTRVRRARARFRRSAQSHLLVSELSQVIESVRPELIVLTPGTVLGTSDSVDKVSTTPLDFGHRAEAVLLERLAPRLADVLEPVSDLVAASDRRFEEMVQVAIYGIEAAQEQDGPVHEAQVELFKVALERALADGEAYATGLNEALGEAETELANEGERAKGELSAMLGPQASRHRVRSQVRATRRAIRQRLLAWGRHLAQSAGATLRRLTRGSGLKMRGHLAYSDVDAAGMRQWIQSVAAPDGQGNLPHLYGKLFSIQPIEDLRLAVAHRTPFELVAKRVGQRGGAARVLVVGAHGSGRTSLLNALELRHQRQRVLRLDAFYHLRHEGIVSALAAELACSDHERAVVAALDQRATVVLIDDLERHVNADETGAAELERLMNIIVQSQPKTAWVVTSTEAGLGALKVIAPIHEAFGSRVDLAGLSGPQIQAVVEARAKLGVTEVHLPRPGFITRLRRGRGSMAELYYARLERVSKGNLRAALQTHLQSLRSVEDGLQAVWPARSHFPFLAHISPRGLAVLSLMLRFGPHDIAELSRALRLSESKVRLHTLNLIEAGLLFRPGGSVQELLYIPAEVEFMLSQAMAHAAMIPGAKR